MKSLMVVFLMSSIVFGWSRDDKANNWSGIDTGNTVSLYAKYDTIKYSKVMRLSDLEDCRVIVRANDTSNAGFKTDSMAIEWGYQTLCPCKNSSNADDTCVDQRVAVDTLDSLAMANFAGAVGSVAGDGTITRSTRIADTLMCAGYAVQSRWLPTEWDVYVRFWVKGIGKNKKTVAVPCKIDFQRRQYINVRNK